ncbi:MAG TPA: hypothetical protein VNT79_07065 [Phycisphaerae bacterium]|nr:hypothetical protein [Phycisphaerae bacterium]
MMRFSLEGGRRLLCSAILMAGMAGLSSALADDANRPPPPGAPPANDDDRPLGGPRARHRGDGPAGGPRAEGDQDRPGDRPPRWRERREARRGERGMGGGDDGPAGPGGFKRPRDRWDEMPEIREEVLAELREAVRIEMPELYERMQQWRERDPERYDQALRRFYPALREYMVLRERQPELAKTVIEEIKIEMRLRRLGREYQGEAETSPRRLELDNELNDLVRRQIDVRIERRAARLLELEERLQREKGEMETQKARVESLIQERLERIKQGKLDEAAGEGRGRRPAFGPRGDRPRDGSGPRPPRRHGPPRRDPKGPDDKTRGDSKDDMPPSDDGDF